MKKKEESKEQLEKMNTGKSTISTIFMSDNQKVKKITKLTNNIASVR